MNVKKNKKIALTSLLLAAMIALSACSSGVDKGTASTTPESKKDASTVAPGENTPKGTVDTSNINPEGTSPILKNKVNLKVLRVQDTNIEDLETNEMTLMIEKAVNVDLSFEYLPSGTESKQKLSVMISSGSKLPDFMSLGLSDLETYTYGTQGYILPLNDYVDQISVNLKEYMDSEDGKQYQKYMYSADGNMYGFPRICQDLGNDWDRRMWINQTWLDKVGMAKPTNTDEYYEVLKAFKTKDPNGNGKADELPLVGNRDGWNQNVWDTLMNAFTYVNSEFEYLQANDGKIAVSYAQDGWKKGLEYMNKLCTEGLLSPLTFTQDQNQFKQILEDQNAQLVGSMTAGSMSVYQVASKRKQDITHIAPLKGPDGNAYTSYRNSGIPNAMGFITKDCADPVAAFMAMDYMCSREMTFQGRFGTKDVDWKAPDADKPGLYEKMGYKPLVQYINPIWGQLQNKHWGEVNPAIRTYDMICGVVWGGDKFDSQYMTAQAVPDYIGKVPEETVQRLLYTPEEAEKITEIVATLKTYREESVAAFITGTRPLTDWDTYLKDLENIGINDFVAIAQTAYDRMKAV